MFILYKKKPKANHYDGRHLEKFDLVSVFILGPAPKNGCISL